MMADITVEEWNRRKDFVGFGDKDVKLLKELEPLIKDTVDGIVDELYNHFLKFRELEIILNEEDTLQRLKATQKEYFLRLLSGNYDEDYLANRIRVGKIHHRIGLTVDWYLGSYTNYIMLISPHLFEAYGSDAAKAQKVFLSLLKLINLDEDVAITTYFNAKEEVIVQQTNEIIELSTPVVQLWDGVVAAPIIGTMDSQRTQLFMEKLLETIVATKSPVALVDITGVPAIDTATAQHLIDTINAVKLLGSQVVITGVSPAIAQTLVHLGIDLAGIITRSSLAAGLRVALNVLHLEIIDKKGGRS